MGTPVLIDVDNDGIELTNPAAGVMFPISTGDFTYQVGWTSAGADDAWLALDRNGNGKIDDGRELFGNFTDQPPPPPGQQRNGFLALAEFDKPANGGNGDGRIDLLDSVFPRLRLWRDVNHDGLTDPGELRSVSAASLTAISLDYKLSRRRDRHGNVFRYWARVVGTSRGDIGRWAIDIVLRVLPRTTT